MVEMFLFEVFIKMGVLEVKKVFVYILVVDLKKLVEVDVVFFGSGMCFGSVIL